MPKKEIIDPKEKQRLIALILEYCIEAMEDKKVWGIYQRVGDEEEFTSADGQVLHESEMRFLTKNRIAEMDSRPFDFRFASPSLRGLASNEFSDVKDEKLISFLNEVVRFW